jgi:Tfp pilus assembly protein PilZ
MSESEKRKHPRSDQENLFVQYRLVKSAFVNAATNISEGGIFIASDTPLPLHSEIDVVLSDGRPESLVLPGKVVRVVWKTQGNKEASTTGMAVAFADDVPAEKRQRLKLLLEKCRMDLERD